ncbi:MAG: hypothetical protein ACLP1X_35125 [Polyangiaceae bacterium]
MQTGRSERSKAFFRVRVTVLLAILAGVLLWGWRDVRSRRERTTWERPLSVALVLVRQGRITDAAVAAFRGRVPLLEMRLAEERRRYSTESTHPFTFTFVGPVDVSEPPPHTVGDGLVAAARHAWAMWRWTVLVDGRAGLDAGAYDSRIYVAARPPASDEREMVEGESEEGGRVGVVEVELDDSMSDFALFVATHELFHTLGATDKYDDAGRTLIPAGLADPRGVPRFPQTRAEVMARNRPVDIGVEVPPESLDELGVGPATAAEIGWSR